MTDKGNKEKEEKDRTSIECQRQRKHQHSKVESHIRRSNDFLIAADKEEICTAGARDKQRLTFPFPFVLHRSRDEREVCQEWDGDELVRVPCPQLMVLRG